MDSMQPTVRTHIGDPAFDDLVGLTVRAALCVGVIGVALGVWCRSFIDGTGGPFGVSIAQLGAPWVAVAFAVGALVVVHRQEHPGVERVGLALGALAGAGTMVVASFAYYGTASSPSAVFWAAAGIVVGGAAGLAGAAWRARPDSIVEVVAAGTLGLALVAEGIGRLDFGWFHVSSDLSLSTAQWLVVAGACVPVVLTRGRPLGFVASVTALLLAAPVAALVVVMSRGLGVA